MSPFKGKNFGIVIIFIVFSLCLAGCGTINKNTSNMDEEKLSLNAGAVMSSQDGEYSIFNYEDGEFSKIDKEKIVLAYDKQSSNYVCIENQMPYIITDKNKFEMVDTDYTALKLSEGGKYVSYFLDVENEGLKFKLINTENNEAISLNTNVVISGIFYDWYDEKTLVYYGISEDGINGIFTYNIDENKEELKYKINGGFVAFIKTCNKNIIFLQSDFQGNKNLMYIEGNADKPVTINNEIEEISDIALLDGKYYFLGNVKNNTKSLYMIENNKAKRVAYDFPTIIKFDKKLCINSNNELIFIGADYSDLSSEQLYKCSSDGTIISLFEKSKDFMFIAYK